MIGTLGMVAAGGAGGAVARWALGLVVPFPFGTLAVNLAGSLAIGLVWGAVAARWHPLLVAGLLGGFTTFSAFSLDVLRLVEAGRAVAAGIYVVASVLGGVLACALGLWLVRGAGT
jgi:CrcB protein